MLQIPTDKLELLSGIINQELIKRSTKSIIIEESSKTEIIIHIDTTVYDYELIIFEYERYGKIITKINHDKIIINYEDRRDCDDAKRAIFVDNLLKFKL